MPECPTCGNEYSIIGNHYRYYPEHKPDEWAECPACGERYNRLGQHWNLSDCDRPQLTERQLDIAIGLLMGDATLLRGDKNAALQVKMISEEYLHHLNNLFGVHSTSVVFCTPAEDSARNCRESGFSPGANAEDYSDLYRWHTRNHPNLNQFRSWYDSGKKVWPRDIILSPTVLKHWFCCDGTRNETPYGQNRVSIAMSNEVDHTDKVDSLFQQSDLPTPADYQVNERHDGSLSCIARWNMEDSRVLWDYMGEAPPGFEYKWPKPR